jgi:hypothetical protein
MLAVLPTCRLFGRISQIGPNKKWSGRKIFGRILADFKQKEPKLKQIFFPPLILSNSREVQKYYYFPTDTGQK